MFGATIYNTLRLQTMNNEWLQKKDSGNVLSKQELNERANWTQDDWLKHDFQEQLENNKEAAKKTALDNKIMSGETLTPEEERYLRENNPGALERYRRTKAEKKAYEEKLRNCKTKDEVQRLKTNTLNGYLSSFKKIENNPNIPMNEKLAKAQEMLGKTRNIQDAERKFMATSEYKNLPTEAEEAVSRADECRERNEYFQEEVSDNIEDADNIENIEDTESIDNPLTTESNGECLNETDTQNITYIEEKDVSHEIEKAYERIATGQVTAEDSGKKVKKKGNVTVKQGIDVSW